MIKKISKTFSTVRMQLVASVFVAIAPVLVLTYLVNQTWFWQFAPDWMRAYFVDLPWVSLTIGLLALAAAWLGGELFILRQVRVLSGAAKRLGTGDLSSRTGLQESPGEFGQLAATFDNMAAALQQRSREREAAEKVLLFRAMQQTVVAALGQFALTNNDLEALTSQAVIQVGHTLEVEYCGFFELMPDGRLLLRAGVGWKSGSVGQATVFPDNRSQAGFTLQSGEPVVVADLPSETRFKPSAFMVSHGVISGVTITIPTRARPFGVLCVHTTKTRTFTTDEVQFLLSVVTAIGMAVQRKHADAELQKLAAFAQLNPNPALEFAADGNITYFNDAAFKLASAMSKNHPRDLLPPDINGIVHVCLSTGRSKLRLETKLEGRTFSWSFHPMPASHVVHCYIEDTTEHLSLEAQLRQSQKMESVGQLAAGVAHDFNNMLTIIQGHSSALLARKDLPEPISEPIQTVYFAAERAASLTRQLLMFSRKNVMQSQPLDLRETVGQMGKMLHRLIGETITLQFHAPEELPVVLGDSGMIEQVLMNLAVNARDAMSGGGTLSIVAEAWQVDETYLELHPEAHIGKFVRLRVSDTGTGMDTKTLAHIFEPFFTTKEVGKGTGLGLATVYGIVKQHDGWVEVTSEPGRGTTFDLFFPASNEMASSVKAAIAPVVLPVVGGTETILVVEDEPFLREMTQAILENFGYRILLAASGKDALAVWRQHAGNIDLVLTDMVMPEGVSGFELAEQLLVQKPGLKIILTSGYTANEVNPEMLAKVRAQFLQKPYSHSDLARIVRDCLDKKEATASETVAG
jgi:signal transduction histidine kinase/CheY-like chemotaxis protein/HAMP domain-containing protein